MLSLLINPICGKFNKVLYLDSKRGKYFTGRHNIGFISDTIVGTLKEGYEKCLHLSYTTTVKANYDDNVTTIIRSDNSDIHGNRVSKQIVENKIFYWYLTLNDGVVTNKILIKSEIFK